MVFAGFSNFYQLALISALSRRYLTVILERRNRAEIAAASRVARWFFSIPPEATLPEHRI